MKRDEGPVEIGAPVRAPNLVDGGAPSVGLEGVGVGTPGFEVATGRVGVVADVCAGGDGDGVAEKDVLGRAAVDELRDGRVHAECFVDGGGEIGEFCEDGGVCGREACGFDFLAEAGLGVLYSRRWVVRSETFFSRDSL